MAKITRVEGKKGVTYRIDYIDPDGKRIREMFKKRKDANAELGKRVSLIAEGRYLDVKQDYTTTLKELLTKYEENFKHQASYKRWKRFCLANFKEYFGAETRLVNIRYVDLETYRNHLKQKLTKKKTIRADATVNREMSCLHHIFTKAVEWELIERNPFDRGKSLILKENNKRLRFLSEEEITKLLDGCPKYLKPVVECALNTGMRRGEILNLKWNQIKDGLIYLEGQMTKTKEPRQVPINDDLSQVFREIRKEKQLRSEYVFFRMRGKPMHSVKRGFKAALERAGIEDFKFHDLRHTFSSHFVMRGGSLKDLQEILGHKTMTMTLRYAHLSQEHKKKAVNLLNGLTACVNSDMSETCQIFNSPLSATL